MSKVWLGQNASFHHINGQPIREKPWERGWITGPQGMTSLPIALQRSTATKSNLFVEQHIIVRKCEFKRTLSPFFFPQLWLNIVEGKVIRIYNRDKSGFACRSVVQFLSDIGLRSLGEEGCDKVASRGCRIRVHLDLEKPRKVRLIAFKPRFDRHPPRWHLGAAGAAHAWTPPPGKGSERRHGFQLMMGGAEQYVSARSMLVLFYIRVK